MDHVLAGIFESVGRHRCKKVKFEGVLGMIVAQTNGV